MEPDRVASYYPKRLFHVSIKTMSVKLTVYHELSTVNTVDTGVWISNLLKVYLRCSKLIGSCHKLCVKMRKMIQDVLYILLKNGPVVSHDRQCAKLAIQNET